MTSVKTYRPGTMLLVALLALTVLCSCINDDMAGCPEGTFHNDASYVVLKVGTLKPQSRADANTADRESINSLRIILLNDQGEVEYNHLSQGDASAMPDGFIEAAKQYYIIRTTAGPKKLFLIANEKSVEGLTDQIETASKSSDGVVDAIKKIYFTPNYDTQSNNIVLSSYYEFEVGPGDLGTEEEFRYNQNSSKVRNFYLVHAATKFEFEFENLRENPITIQSLTLNEIANQMYLLPNFGSDGSLYPTTGAGCDFPKTVDGAQYEAKNWIDWLKGVCEDTNNNQVLPGNASVNEKWGWISDYNLPAGTEHQGKTLVAEPVIVPTGAKPTTLPIVYYPESKNIPEGQTDQKYTFSLTLKEGENSEPIHFTDISLTGENNGGVGNGNLKTLFRNTHVKVHVLMKGEDQEVTIQLRIGICPWDYGETNIPTFD